MRKFMALAATLCAFMLLAASTVTPAAAQDTRITLLHGIPGAEVDVEINGDIAIEGFSFGDREDISALAGETLDSLRLLAAGGDAEVLSMDDLTLAEDGNFTYIAHLNEDSEPDVTRFANSTDSIAAGKGRLTIRHAAGLGPVDIMLDGGEAMVALTNAREGSAAIDAGSLELAVTDVDTGDTLIGPADLDVIEGESIVVYAVGTGDSLTVLTETVVLGDAMDDTSMDDDEMDETDDSNTDDTDDTDDAGATDEDDDGEDTAMNSAPNGVETGNSPITSQSFPLAALAIGVIAISSAGMFGLRRYDLNR